jgi:hypothetical protein
LYKENKEKGEQLQLKIQNFNFTDLEKEKAA